MVVANYKKESKYQSWSIWYGRKWVAHRWKVGRRRLTKE